MKSGRKPEYLEKTSGDKPQKMPHTTSRILKPQVRLEPAQKHRWQARQADVLTVTPRVALKNTVIALSPMSKSLLLYAVHKKKRIFLMLQLVTNCLTETRPI